MHFSQALAKRGIVSISLHPGIIEGTSLGSANAEAGILDAAHKQARDMGMTFKTPATGSSTTLVAALDPKAKEYNGSYLADCQVAQTGPGAKKEGAAEELWKLSEKLVEQEFAF